MRQYLYLLSLGVLLLLGAGCEKIIDFDGRQPPKKLVVTTMVGCDTELSTLTISESFLIYGENDEFDMPEEGEVKIEINGEECEILEFYVYEYDRIVKCYFDAQVKENDVIRVSVRTDKHPVATGEERVPPPPVIVDVQTEPFYTEPFYSEYGAGWTRALIRIKDDPGVSNYYRLFIKQYYDEERWYYIDYHIDQDLVMSSLSSQEIQEGDGDTNRMRIFPDDLFNGKEYTLNIYFWDPNYYEYEGNGTLMVELQSLSESMYLYMRSLEMSYNSDIFSEPVRIYSNIQGGYGIVGAYNSTVRVVDKW
ncbi:MAG: DUF4249 domain-containing protein [Tannerellaceae bacterium]|nr:DUF4249 domain-containing protein [Tannerellaceae bacterium]